MISKFLLSFILASASWGGASLELLQRPYSIDGLSVRLYGDDDQYWYGMNAHAAPNLAVEQRYADIYRYPKPFDPATYERLTTDEDRAVGGRLMVADDLLFFAGRWMGPFDSETPGNRISRDHGETFVDGFDHTLGWVLEQNGVLYGGSDADTVFVSADGGIEWTRVSGTAGISGLTTSNAVHLGDRLVIAWNDLLGSPRIQRIDVAADGVTFESSVRLMEDFGPLMGEMSYDPVSGIILLGGGLSAWRNQDHAESAFTPSMRWPGLGFEGEVDTLSEWSTVRKVQHDPKYAGRFVVGGDGVASSGNEAFLAWTWDGGTTWENLSAQLGPRSDRVQSVVDLRVGRDGRIFVVVNEIINSIEGLHENVLYELHLPDPVAEAYPGASYLGDGSWSTDWLGTFYGARYPWAYHATQGVWRWIEDGKESGGWVWDTGLGWIWEARNTYPWIWSDRENSWLYYWKPTKHPRWFLKADGSWLEG